MVESFVDLGFLRGKAEGRIDQGQKFETDRFKANGINKWHLLTFYLFAIYTQGYHLYSFLQCKSQTVLRIDAFSFSCLNFWFAWYV